MEDIILNPIHEMRINEFVIAFQRKLDRGLLPNLKWKKSPDDYDDIDAVFETIDEKFTVRSLTNTRTAKGFARLIAIQGLVSELIASKMIQYVI